MKNTRNNIKNIITGLLTILFAIGIVFFLGAIMKNQHLRRSAQRTPVPTATPHVCPLVIACPTEPPYRAVPDGEHVMDNLNKAYMEANNAREIAIIVCEDLPCPGDVDPTVLSPRPNGATAPGSGNDA